MSANPHANGGVLRIPLRLPDFGAYAVPVTTPGASRAPATQILGQFLRDVMRDNMGNFRVFGPDETASNRLQAIYDASKKTWLAGYQARGRRRRRARARRTRHGNAQRAHARRLGGRLRPDRPPCVFRVLRSVLPHHRFHGQPAREVAGEVQDRGEMAGVDSFIESVGDVDRVAAGPQRLYAPGSRLPRCCHEQERGRHPHLSPARRELPPERGRSLLAKRRLRERHRRRQTAPSAVSGHRGRHQALRKGYRHLDLGQHGSERRTRCRHRERGRCGHGGSAGRNRHPA